MSAADYAAARRQAETTARDLLRVADDTALGAFEGELVDCISALLAASPEPAPDAPLPLPDCCTHDPSLVCLRCRDFDVTTGVK